MLTPATPITPAIRETIGNAITPGADDTPTMFDAGNAHYARVLRATPDGAPLGELIDVVEMYDLHDA